MLERYAGDVAAVPVVWYIGYVPADDSPTWDTVPYPGAGNRLTPREYQDRWLDKYAATRRRSRGIDDRRRVPRRRVARRASPSSRSRTAGRIPAPADLFAVAPVDSPHHDYPAWDWVLPVGTPIYAVRGGTVTTVQYWPYNWWDAGCGTGGQGCVVRAASA